MTYSIPIDCHTVNNGFPYSLFSANKLFSAKKLF
ncbi:not available [Yersinia enterocolitica]|nr:not available [Yersinia enterocolitica]